MSYSARGMKAVCGIKMIKQLSRGSRRQASRSNTATVSYPAEHKQTDRGNPEIVSLSTVGGLHSIRGSKVSFSKEALGPETSKGNIY